MYTVNNELRQLEKEAVTIGEGSHVRIPLLSFLRRVDLVGQYA